MKKDQLERIRNLIIRAIRRVREDGVIVFLYYFLVEFVVCRVIRDIYYRVLKLFVGNDKFLLKEIQGSKMCLSLEDSGISKDLILDKIREPKATKTMQERIDEGDVIVDIGANIGYYTLIESRLVGKKGKVYAIEPVPENVELLRKNVRINDYKNVEIFPLAIGNKNGIAEIYISEESNLHSMIYQRNKVLKKIDVEIVTLDNFLRNKKIPNFVRMDVEGYEYEIIIGMTNTLENNKLSKLFIEVHPGIMGREKTVALFRLLKKLGFNTKKVIKDDGAPGIFNPWWYRSIFLSNLDCSSMTIDDLLQNESIINGEKASFEIFFEKKDRFND